MVITASDVASKEGRAMHTIGRLEDIYVEDGLTKGLVAVEGKRRAVTLTLMLNARVGDEVMIESGFAFPKPDARRRSDVLSAESHQ